MAHKFYPLGPSFYTLNNSSSTELLNVSSESIGIISSKLTKTYILTYLGPIWKKMAHRGHFLHITENTHNIPVSVIVQY